MKNIEDFYDEVASSIARIKEKLLEENQDQEDSQINHQIFDVLTEFEKHGLHELEKLKKNQNWNTFVIAFYGETNAGKSTLIEALRLYFNEETKMQQQREFEEKSALYFAVKEKHKLSVQKENKEKELQVFLSEQNLISRLWIFLGMNATARQIKAEIEIITKEIDSIGSIGECEMDEILHLQDGSIIGDGRSDFTRDAKEYHFQYHGENFILVDVPGIEGSEDKVLKEIGNATKKAHAIFYVKTDPTPPQKGDNDKKGTIEKIKEQLNAQTEVWTIYNKPITNPRVLSRSLVDDNIQESLNVLDEKMCEILGKNYLGHKVVSAQPAFFALAKSVFPDTELGIKMNDFLDKCVERNMTREDILMKSGFIDFAEFLGNTFIQDAKQKIRKSNFNKAYIVVSSLKKNLDSNIENYEKKLEKDEDETNRASESLWLTLESFISGLHNQVRDEIRKLIDRTREKTYAYIDLDKKDSEVEAFFKDQIEKQMEVFEKNVEGIVVKQQHELQKRLQDDLEKYQEKIRENLEDASKIEIFDEFGNQIKIDVDQNFDFFGFFSSLGGAALGVWGGIALLATPVIGWITIVASILTGIIGAGRVVLRWLKLVDKKAQQQKSIEKNLREVKTKIEDQIENMIQNNKIELEGKIRSIEEKMRSFLVQGKRRVDILKKEGRELEQIAEQIVNTIKEEIK